MGQAVPHSGNLYPWHVGLLCQQLSGESLDGLTNLDQSGAHRVEDEAIGEIAALQMAPDSLNRGEDVLQALVIMAAHTGCASARTKRATPDLRSPAGIRSTLTPRSASRSRSARPSPTSPMPGGTSTSRSMSLAAVSSPRTTLPKTRTFVSPYRAAISRTSALWRARCRARLPRSLPSRGLCSCTRTLSSQPVAWTRRWSVGRDGWRAPDS